MNKYTRHQKGPGNEAGSDPRHRRTIFAESQYQEYEGVVTCGTDGAGLGDGGPGETDPQHKGTR